MTLQTPNKIERNNWALACINQSGFDEEQIKLGRIWNLVGVTSDLAKDGDWFRATLGGRSIFVQRFGDAIKGFENRCVHRFFPLRTQDKGNGPVVCGFHHWRYDAEGRAVGIPMCTEIFGVTPRELGARLNPVEIATCGSLIFGRFNDRGVKDSLEEFLGDGFPILASLGAMPATPHFITRPVEANWKLSIQITLDDYHIVAVHPGTFGKGGYLKNQDFRYFRFGLHSAHFTGAEAESLSSMADACRRGDYRPREYRIFNIFPNLAVSMFRASPYWYVFVQQFVPVAPGRSIARGWFYPVALPQEESRLSRLTRPITEPVRALIVRYYIRKIGNEDHVACERIQTIAHQIRNWPILGSQEERIEWFEDSYAQAMSGAPEGLH